MSLPRRLLALASVALVTGCAKHHAIIGTVIDRNGEPMDRVIMSLDPGGVELITDSEGQFMIDYLRDESGERTKMNKRTEYTLEAFRTGYHVSHQNFFFKKGELFLEPITMAEDTIRVPVGTENIDPDRFPDRTQSTGATYEGE